MLSQRFSGGSREAVFVLVHTTNVIENGFSSGESGALKGLTDDEDEERDSCKDLDPDDEEEEMEEEESDEEKEEEEESEEMGMDRERLVDWVCMYWRA